MKRILPIVMLSLATTTYAAPVVIFKESLHPTERNLRMPTSPALNKLIQSIKDQNNNALKIIVYKQGNEVMIYTLSGTNWGMKKTKVQLDTVGNITNVIDNYTGDMNQSPKNTRTLSKERSVCPDESIQFLVISAFPGVGEVNRAIKTVSAAASKKFKTMTILNENADGKTYKNWLSCSNLKGIYSIGHGSPDEIMVGNGDLISYDFFNQPHMKNKYKNTTVIFNACQVYNYPMGTSVIYGNNMFASNYAQDPGTNAHEFIGGHTNLLMEYSELSSACFMVKALEGAKMNYDTLKQCIGKRDIHFQNFGLSNQETYFTF